MTRSAYHSICGKLLSFVNGTKRLNRNGGEKGSLPESSTSIPSRLDLYTSSSTFSRPDVADLAGTYALVFHCPVSCHYSVYLNLYIKHGLDDAIIYRLHG